MSNPSTTSDLRYDAVMALPPTLFDFAAYNEDATVELLVLDALVAAAPRPLRVLTVAGCGTHAVTMCSSPHVERVDAVDIVPPQLKLGALMSAAVEASSSPEELAVFIGNSGEASDRRAVYPRVRAFLDADVAEFWDANTATIEAGVLRCGGTERSLASVRAHFPTQDLPALAGQPDAIAAAFRAGFTVQALEDQMVGMPREAMEAMAQHGPQMMAAFLTARLAECADGDPDLMVELVVRGSFAMTPIASRPQFLRPGVFAAIKQNGCGRDRIAWHEGPIQVVGQALARDTGPYDLVDMSNFLSADSPDAHAIIEGIQGAVRPGGTLLSRGTRPPGTLARAFTECGLEVDEALSARALDAESSFLHNEVYVAATQ